MLLAPVLFLPCARRCVLLLVVCGFAVTPRAGAPSRAVVVDRAGAWVERFGSTLRGVVARERYLQTVRTWPGSPPSAPAAGVPTDTRRLLSSLLLVHDAASPWQLHRDVLSVDDVAVAGREDRLAVLFAGRDDNARQRLRAITEDSARHNLGHVTRNINVPTFPLLVVHPAWRERFRFRDTGRTREDDTAVRLIGFEEKGRPRIVRGMGGRDVVLEGVLVVEEMTGAFVRAVVAPRARDLHSRLEVHFGRVPGLPVRVPVRMWEWYWVRAAPQRERYVEGEATYDDFRRYTTDVGQPVVR